MCKFKKGWDKQDLCQDKQKEEIISFLWLEDFEVGKLLE